MRLLSLLALVFTTNLAAAELAENFVANQMKLQGGKIIKQFESKETGLVGFVVETSQGDRIPMYADKQGRYLLTGLLIDSKGRNLSAIDASMHIPALPKADMVKIAESGTLVSTGKTRSKKVVYVVGEPNCGWCRKQHFDLKQADVEVRWLMIGYGQEGEEKTARILSAKDPSHAIAANFESGDPGDIAVTDEVRAKVRENQVLAKRMGVQGTPFLFYRDNKTGEVVTAPGAMLGDRLKAWLDGIS